MTNKSKDVLSWPIMPSENAKPYSNGNMNAELDERKKVMNLHSKTIEDLIEGGVELRCVVTLLSYLQNFPTTVSAALSWTHEETKMAYESFADCLSQYIPRTEFEITPRTRVMGAYPPINKLSS